MVEEMSRIKRTENSARRLSAAWELKGYGLGPNASPGLTMTARLVERSSSRFHPPILLWIFLRVSRAALSWIAPTDGWSYDNDSVVGDALG
jgi:hypothetical protein